MSGIFFFLNKKDELQKGIKIFIFYFWGYMNY